MNIINIIIMFVVLAVLSVIIYNIFGVNVTYDVEKFTFCNPDDCSCTCNRNMYKNYCNSPYLKDGPEALCNCKWDDQKGLCMGTRADNARCTI